MIGEIVETALAMAAGVRDTLRSVIEEAIETKNFQLKSLELESVQMHSL